MASGRSTNTMVEGLQNVLRDISQMKTMPDANLDFLVNLETNILQFLRAPMEQQMQAQSAPGSTSPGAPPPSGPSFVGAGVPNLPTGTGGKIPSEELARLFSQAQ